MLQEAVSPTALSQQLTSLQAMWPWCLCVSATTLRQQLVEVFDTVFDQLWGGSSVRWPTVTRLSVISVSLPERWGRALSWKHTNNTTDVPPSAASWMEQLNMFCMCCHKKNDLISLWVRQHSAYFQHSPWSCYTVITDNDISQNCIAKSMWTALLTVSWRSEAVFPALGLSSSDANLTPNLTTALNDMLHNSLCLFVSCYNMTKPTWLSKPGQARPIWYPHVGVVPTAS